MRKQYAVISGLIAVAAVALIVVRFTPAIQADLFDSPIPTPYAYLPFVASKPAGPPPARFWVYLPVVARNGPIAVPLPGDGP